MKTSAFYRPDVDGLRAIAILAVMIYHTFPKLLPGGFFGVGVFFIISGYLITGIIQRDLNRGNFQFLDFWARRARRILPALLLVLLASLFAGWLYLLPAEFESLKAHAQWSLGFATNFKLISEVGYFDVAAELKQLLHLWSLAIEEQFYLIWPFIMWICCRCRIPLFAATLVLVLAGFGIRKLHAFIGSEAFYLPWAVTVPIWAVDGAGYDPVA